MEQGMNLRADAAVKGLEKLRSSDAWANIEREFLATGNAANVHSGLSRAIDAIAIEAYAAAIEPVLPQGAAMLALGGFGRQELFPYSDVELLIVIEADSPWVALREVLSEFVRLLWDAGLRLNHMVRTLDECVGGREQNPEFAISLLERRFLAGDSDLHQKLESKLPALFTKLGPKLSEHLCQLARLRHTKYQNTFRHRQPDVKETPGGLRDFHLIGHLVQLGGDRTNPAADLKEAAGFLAAVRCFLHYNGQSDRNLLDFEAQENITGQAFARGRSSAVWMKEYFQRAATIFKEARRALDASEKSQSSLLENFRDWRSRLSNSEFTVSREHVLLRNPAQLESDPAVVFRLLEFMARHGLRLSAETERRMAAAQPAFSGYCAQPQPLWATLECILSLPHATAALRALDDTGLLPALLPEWADIENVVVPDSEYRYTIDEHTLLSAERATDLRGMRDPARQRFAQLLSEIDNPALLLFALLFHEMGKQTGGDSLEQAASRAREAMARIQMPAEEQGAVEFLILHQFDLSEVMAGRDVDDPATVRLLAERVGTIERLKLLTVLTYADLSALSHDALSPWRLEQLWRVYQLTQHELTRELETDRIQEVPENLSGHASFIKGFPVRYLRAHDASEIEAHIRLYEFSRPTGVAIDLQRIEGAHRLTIIARDMPFLFASFAGAISSFGLDILKAEAFSNTKGLILDTFVFADPKRTLDLNPPEVERLQDMIRRVALGKTDAQRLLRNRVQLDPKKRTAPAQVQFDSDACETATLVEIAAEDRPGLLYDLATVLSSNGCNIDVVLIDTKGHRAMDVFYVAQDGQKLTPDSQAMLKEKLLAVC
jgi:[protein-PII] uridylyltransferase